MVMSTCHQRMTMLSPVIILRGTMSQDQIGLSRNDECWADLQAPTALSKHDHTRVAGVMRTTIVFDKWVQLELA